MSERYDGIAAHYNLSCMVDAIMKDTRGYRTRTEVKAAIKAAYLEVLAQAPTKVAGRRALGNLSNWYDGINR